MTAAPAMTGGMTGKAQTSTLNMMPGGGQGSEEIIDIPPAYKSEPIAPKLYPNRISMSLISAPHTRIKELKISITWVCSSVDLLLS